MEGASFIISISFSHLCARPLPMFRDHRSDKFSAFIIAACLWDNLIRHWLIGHYCYRRLKYVNWDPYGLLLQLCSPLTVYIWNRSINFSFKSSPALRPQASSSVKLGNEPLPPSGPVLSFLMRDPIRIALIFKSFLPRIRSSWKNTDTFSHIRGMHAFFMTPAQLRWIKFTLDGTQLFWCADG